MARKRFSPKLMWLLVTRGVCRAVLPLAVLWGIADWYRVRPIYGLIFAALTLNYVLVYILVWVAPHLLNGPWRVRPWQTFILLANAIILPITFRRELGTWPWGFMCSQLMMIAALVVATKILFYLQSRVPAALSFPKSHSYPDPRQAPTSQTNRPARTPSTS